MGSTTITAGVAGQRHPEEAAAIVKRINAARRRKDKEAPPLGIADVSWHYSTAIRIAEGSRHAEAGRFRGRQRLELVKNDFFVQLAGAHGRHQVEVPLDPAALLAGPDDRLPIEVLGGPAPLPQAATTPRLWLWQPTHENAPGWVAHAVLAARPAPGPQHPQGLLLELDRAGETSSVWFDGEAGFHDAHTEAYAAATRPRRVRTGASVDLTALVSAHADSLGRWKGLLTEATVAELLNGLRGPGFMAVSVGGAPSPALTSPSSEPAPGPSARFFDTHETLSAEDLSALATLEERASGVLRGTDLFSALGRSDPYRSETGETEHRVALRAVANGEAVSEAVARGKAAIEARQSASPFMGTSIPRVFRHG